MILEGGTQHHIYLGIELRGIVRYQYILLVWTLASLDLPIKSKRRSYGCDLDTLRSLCPRSLSLFTEVRYWSLTPISAAVYFSTSKGQS